MTIRKVKIVAAGLNWGLSQQRQKLKWMFWLQNDSHMTSIFFSIFHLCIIQFILTLLQFCFVFVLKQKKNCTTLNTIMRRIFMVINIRVGEGIFWKKYNWSINSTFYLTCNVHGINKLLNQIEGIFSNRGCISINCDEAPVMDHGAESELLMDNNQVSAILAPAFILL